MKNENIPISPEGLDKRARAFEKLAIKSHDPGLESQEEVTEQLDDGKKIKNLRQKYNLDRQQLAILVNTDRDEIFILENGMLEDDERRIELMKLIEERLKQLPSKQ